MTISMITTSVTATPTPTTESTISPPAFKRKRGISFAERILSIQSLFLLINDYLMPTETARILANTCPTFNKFVTPQLFYRQLGLNLRAFPQEVAFERAQRLIQIDHYFIEAPNLKNHFGLSDHLRHKHTFVQLEKMICRRENLILRTLQIGGFITELEEMIDVLLAGGVSPNYEALSYAYFLVSPQSFRKLLDHSLIREEELNDLLDNCLLNIGNMEEDRYPQMISKLECFLEKGIKLSQDSITSVRSDFIPYASDLMSRMLEDRIFAKSSATRTTSRWLSDISMERVQGRDLVALPPLAFKAQTPFIKKLQIGQIVAFSKGHIVGCCIKEKSLTTERCLVVYDQTSAQLKWNIKMPAETDCLNTPQGILVCERICRRARILDIHTGKATNVILPAPMGPWGSILCTPSGMYYQVLSDFRNGSFVYGFKLGEEGRRTSVFVKRIDSSIKTIASHGHFLYSLSSRPSDNGVSQMIYIHEILATEFSSSTDIRHQRELFFVDEFPCFSVTINVLDDGTLVYYRASTEDGKYTICLIYDMREMLTLPERLNGGKFYLDAPGNAVWILKEQEIWKYSCSEGTLISQHMGHISHPARSFHVVDGVFYYHEDTYLVTNNQVTI